MSSADTADARRPIRRALVSVYDKSGLPELADALNAAGVAIVSTGSTAKTIAAQGVPVTSVEDLTGFPECLDGRVKTLHPRVHAGILADTGNPDHLRQLEDLGVEPFDLVVANLYPFRETVARWINDTLIADLFVAPSSNEIVGPSSFVPPPAVQFMKEASDG